jgi:hypothetical protein
MCWECAYVNCVCFCFTLFLFYSFPFIHILKWLSWILNHFPFLNQKWTKFVLGFINDYCLYIYIIHVQSQVIYLDSLQDCKFCKFGRKKRLTIPLPLYLVSWWSHSWLPKMLLLLVMNMQSWFMLWVWSVWAHHLILGLHAVNILGRLGVLKYVWIDVAI